jgi:hypothetical protein
MKLVKSFLEFTVFSKLIKESSSWGKIFYSSKVNEGISLSGEEGNPEIIIDFDKDSERDMVSLNPPKDFKKQPTHKRAGKKPEDNIPVYRGHLLNKKLFTYQEFKDFTNLIKQWGAIESDDLRSLIDLTYPTELKNKSVQIIFATGSSDPLSIRIAEALKELYYPKCKIIDVLKRYYSGYDPDDMINWEAYSKADATTKGLIDTWLAKFKPSTKINAETGLPEYTAPRHRYEGHIKKSIGLQGGPRDILNPGHTIDFFIMNNIMKAEIDWSRDYGPGSGMPFQAAMRYQPSYLFVDDLYVVGSTVKGIFKEMVNAINSDNIADTNTKYRIKKNMVGYCLFSTTND